MKKHCVRILGAFFGLAALTITAKGQAVDQIVVNVPYELSWRERRFRRALTKSIA